MWKRFLGVIYPDEFSRAAFDPDSGAIAIVLDETQAANQGQVSGIYLRKPQSAVFELQRAGTWSSLAWEPGGAFVATGDQGVSIITPEGDTVLLTSESNLRISPSGNWMVGWGDGETQPSGARLYQGPGGNLLQSITDLQVSGVFWQADSKAFYLVAEGVLYRVAFPGLNLEEIASGYADGTPLPMVIVE